MPAETVVALKAHLAINVRNVKQSTEFYRKMFGIEPAKSELDTRSSTCRTRR
jgi:catechol 2,3-dioxygenase-like lactoylglutathione lyase family enzyme